MRRNALNKAGELVGKNIWCGRVSIRDGLDNFIKALLPYCQDFDHVAVVESTYNWYCLADVFEERGWLLRIADPSTVSQATWDEGTKNGPDRSALLGHNFVYQETKPHGFYSSWLLLVVFSPKNFVLTWSVTWDGVFSDRRFYRRTASLRSGRTEIRPFFDKPS